MNSIKDPAQSRRIKIVIVAAIAVIVIFFVGIWAFSTAINSSKKNNQDKNETSETAEKTEKTENKTEDNNLSSDATANSPSNQYVATETPNQNTNQSTEQVVSPAPAISAEPVATAINDDIPTTGPEDVLFSAIMVGVVAALISVNIELKRAER